MPTPYRLSARALRDLRSICSYIAQDKESAAIRVESAILEACELLSVNPLMGSERPDETDRPVRFWPISRYPTYLIVYLPETKPLQIVAILHGRRNTRMVLKRI
jgi:plasmid stabilization system protein ParE